jgi:hypothetical protein
MTTTKYDMFIRHPKNRPFSEIGIRKKIRAFRRMGAWVPGCPLLCVRQPGGKLMVYDGQNRLDAAARLQIPVWYVVDPSAAKHEPKDFNCNDAQSSWTIGQYVDVEVDAGNSHYVQLRQFAHTYGLPLSVSAGLLLGTSGGCGQNTTKAIQEGRFEIRDLAFAQDTASVISALIRIHKDLKSLVFFQAVARCMMVRDKGFDPSYFIEKCNRVSHMLKPCGTVEQYTVLFEEIYNFQSRTKKMPLAYEAKEAAQQRKTQANSKYAGVL